MRRLLPFLAAHLLTTPALAQEEPASIFIDRVDVSVVNVEVFVTDRDGRRVPGLGPDDFELYEDGRPVEISNFYAAVREDRVLRELEEDRALVTGEPTPAAARRELPEDQRLNLMVYVDHFNLRPGNRQRVLDELEGFLEDRVIQGDQVMVVGFQQTLRVEQPFTTDGRLLREAVRRLGKAATHRQIDDAERRRAMREMSAAAAEGDVRRANQFVRSYIRETRSELRRAMAALGDAVRALAGLPGRKAILYVSDGLPMRPGEALYQHLNDLFGGRALRSLSEDIEFIDPSIEALGEDQSQLFGAVTREANAHQVTFYTLDARGSLGDSTLAADRPNLAAGTGGRTSLDNLLSSGLQEPLIEIADATGGTPILDTFDFGGALAGLAEDLDSFYSLGYRSPRGGDGRYHKIEVRVKRPGLRLRHRTGYVDKPQEERVADRTLSSLLLDLSKNPLGVAVDFGRPGKQRRKRYLLPILVRIPIREIGLLPRGEVEEGRLRIYLVVRDDEGGISALHSEPYPVSIPRELVAEAREREIGYSVNLEVRPGVPTVAVGVWDELSGVESFVNRRVAVGARQGEGAGGRR